MPRNPLISSLLTAALAFAGLGAACDDRETTEFAVGEVDTTRLRSLTFDRDSFALDSAGAPITRPTAPAPGQRVAAVDSDSDGGTDDEGDRRSWQGDRDDDGPARGKRRHKHKGRGKGRH